MKKYHFYIGAIAVLLGIASGLLFAQDAAPEPTPVVAFDYNRDRLQYSGLEIAPQSAALVAFDYNRDRLQYSGLEATAKPDPLAGFDYSRDLRQYSGPASTPQPVGALDFLRTLYSRWYRSLN